jgi:hypothetical protein
MVLSILFGQSTSGMWGLINTLQLINYSAMMTLYYPKIVGVILNFIGIANMDNQYLSNVYRLHFDESKFEGRDPWDYRFENQGIDSTNILMNCSDTFLVLILIVLYFSFIFILSKIFAKPDT